MTPPTKTPRSRRDRPAKPALSREGIIATAIDLLQTQALDKVTLRRIAAALDTGAASLYVYIRDTEDLHAGILEALLARVADSVPQEGAWDERLIALLMNYTDVLLNYPGIARLTLFTQPSGPNYFSVVERILALLDEGGVPPRDAAWAVDLLLQLTTATAAEQGTRKTDLEAAAAMSSLFVNISTADAGTYPHIARLADELVSGGPDRIRWMLRVLIAGVLALPRPAGAVPERTA